jgi:hypothetical protein
MDTCQLTSPQGEADVRIWREYDVTCIGGGGFTLRLILLQKVAPLNWSSDTHTHTHTHTLKGLNRELKKEPKPPPLLILSISFFIKIIAKFTPAG